MTLAQSAARGSAVTLGSQVVKFVVMLGSTMALARLISPRDYGLVAMVAALIGVAEIFRDFGLSMAAVQARVLSAQQQSNLFWLNVLIGGVLTGVVFMLAGPIAEFYEEPELVRIVEALSFTFVLGGLSTQFKVSINRELRFGALAVIDLLPYLVALAAALAVAVMAGDYRALVVQQLTLAVSALLLSILLCRWRPGLPRRTDMGALLSFGFNFAGTQLLSYLSRNVDSIALGRVSGSVELGMYDRAYGLVTLPLTQINTPLSRVAIPVLARLTEERERLMSYLRQAQLVALYLTASVFLLLAALGQQLVILLLGSEWQEAGKILSILAISGVFRSITQVTYWLYMSQGLAKEQFRFHLVAQPLLVVCIVTGVAWGPVGVATAVALGYALNWVGALWWVGRVSGLSTAALYVDAARAVLWFGAPAALLAFVGKSLVAGEGSLTKIGLGLVFACGWYALAYLSTPRIRADIGVLLRFGRMAVRGA